MDIENTPLVTVYITNYNYCSFIDEAVQSVLSQTYKNIEIILIDDGSTDNSVDIIRKYEGFENIQIVLQSNKGLAKTNNVALRLANGEFIVRLDADDIFYIDAIENLVGNFTSEDIGLVFGNWDVIDSVGNFVFTYKRHDFKDEVNLLDSPAHGACTMFRTEYLRNVGGYDEELLCQDGYELWFRFIEKFKVRNLDSVIFKYRRHGSNLTGNEDRILTTRANILRKHANRKGSRVDVIAILPIRGGKLDGRDRPFTKIGQRFLIDCVIEDVLLMGVFSAFVVTTPDEEIIEHVRSRYGNKVIVLKRSIKDSYINVTLESVVSSVLDSNPSFQNVELGMLFGLDRPINKKHLITSAIDIAHIFEVDNVIGVRPTDQLFYQHTGSSLKCINKSFSNVRLERDELYEMVKGFNVFKIKNLKNQGSIWGTTIGHVVFDQQSAFSIKSKLDIKIAELFSVEN